MSETESGPRAHSLWRHRPTGNVYRVVSTPLTEHFAEGEYKWVPGVRYARADGDPGEFVRTLERFLERFAAVREEDPPR